jgi:hypothetical protein
MQAPDGGPCFDPSACISVVALCADKADVREATTGRRFGV